MSVINQMLRDLERHRPLGGMHGLQDVVGNFLPSSAITPAKRSILQSALWAMPLLATGLLVGVAVLPPSVLSAISLTSVTRIVADTAVAPSPSIPVVPDDSLRSDLTLNLPARVAQVPRPLFPVADLSSITEVPPRRAAAPSSITEARKYAEVDDIITATALSQAAPKSGTVVLALHSSTAEPETTLTRRPLAQSGTLEEHSQRIAQTPRPQLLDAPAHAHLQESIDASIISKQVKEITPAQQAENEYRKATELLQQRRKTRAREVLAQALQLDASHVAARQTLAGLLVDAKRSDEAEQLLQEGLKIDAGLGFNQSGSYSDSRIGWAMMLARLQVERGDTRAGLNTLQRSVPDVPESAAEYANYQAFLAALQQREGRHVEAIEHYLKALSKTPQSGVWLMGIGISLQAKDRLQDAQEAFQRAKASNTLSPDLLAFVEQRLKQFRL